MIRFCDKEVYNITEGEMTREQMLSFFKQNEQYNCSVIAVYSEQGGLQGVVTYQDLIGHEDLCIRRERIVASDSFWKEAEGYFKSFPDVLLPLIDHNDSVIGFAFDDMQGYYYIEEGMKLMDCEYAWAYFAQKYPEIKMIVITDLNELAWGCYELFRKMGYEICVIGEKWEWFGFRSGENYLEYPEYAKFYIYAEGADYTRKADENQLKKQQIVQDAFRFIIDINDEIRKFIYQETLKLLRQKGISVCECIVPSTVQYRTELERKCGEKKVSLEKYLDESNKDKSSIEQYIFEMYGEENVRIIQKEGGKGRYIPVGNYIGQTILNFSYKKRIYLIGPCISDGYGCKAADALGAQLQRFVEQYEYQVIAVTIEMFNWESWQMVNMGTIPIRECDIVCVIYDEKWFPDRKTSEVIPRVYLSALYNNPNRNSMFCRMMLHTNPEGNRVIAGEIYECYLKDEIIRLCSKKGNAFLQKGEILNEENITGIKEYTAGIYKASNGKVGAIVMNCNPFTYGHRYLVEYAAEQMELLYIFVVEEDRSYFSFSDRLEMVKRGTEDFVNVVVVPSGKWVLSYTTMPAYFRKEDKQDIQVDASLDLQIFCRYIAPGLGIQKRFVGEEPFDQLTRQYNEQMREVLKEFDIEFEEIPRKTHSGQVISASYVRQCIREEKWDQIKGFIPETSYQICLRCQPNSGDKDGV